MTKLERYINEIIEVECYCDKVAVVNDKPVFCSGIFCEDCELRSDGDDPFCGDAYRERITAWLRSDDGEPSPERLAGEAEAWELARKIVTTTEEGGFSASEKAEIFNTVLDSSILNGNAYSEAVEKVKKWKESKKEINVGDEFNSEIGYKCVVTRVSPNGEYIDIMWGDGSTREWEICKFRQKFNRTNKTYPVENLLNQMRGENIE